MANGSAGVELSTGTVVGGRYEVVCPISSGAMGAVFRARETDNGTEVALKRLTDLRHAARFEIEARLLASLRHPRVVRVRNYLQDETGQYVVMDLVEGVDLGDLLKREGQPGLPLGDAIEYARQACEALQYVHEQQIVHRDVKPQNMILGEDGIVLVDFGVARARRGGRRDDRGRHSALHGAGGLRRRSGVHPQRRLRPGEPLDADRGQAAGLRRSHQALRHRPDVPPALEETISAGLEMIPERVASVSAFAKALGAPLQARRAASRSRSASSGRMRRGTSWRGSCGPLRESSGRPPPRSR